MYINKKRESFVGWEINRKCGEVPRYSQINLKKCIQQFFNHNYAEKRNVHHFLEHFHLSHTK